MSNGELFELFAAPSSDETKRQQLIHATEDNADNHTAWIIHVESVLSEAGDPIGNEEETARCNALNIRPAKPEEEAIEIADDSDVKVVGMARTRTPQGRPQGQHGKKVMRNPERRPTKRNKWLLSFLCLLAACAGVIIIMLWPHNRTSGIEEAIDTTKTDSTGSMTIAVSSTGRLTTTNPGLVEKSPKSKMRNDTTKRTEVKKATGTKKTGPLGKEAKKEEEKPRDKKNNGEKVQPAPAPQPKGKEGSEFITKLRDLGIIPPQGMAEEDNDE